MTITATGTETKQFRLQDFSMASFNTFGKRRGQYERPPQNVE